MNVVVPDEPPALGAGAWRALLSVLTDSAEREFGPDWREHLQVEHRQGPGSVIPTPGDVDTRTPSSTQGENHG